MLLFRAPVLFLMLVAACVAAPTSLRASTSDPEIARRWYSIPDEHEAPPGNHRPWPVGDDGSRTITYCFENVQSYHALANIFALGLAKWEPATRVSALKFAPDPACQQEPCLCDEPDVAEGTLNIGLQDGNGPAKGTVGYNVHGDSRGEAPNRLTWPTDDPEFFGPLAPLLMAHELGKHLC